MILRTPQTYDTTTLNYNRQIWNTRAFSLYSTSTGCIDEPAAKLAVEAMRRFLAVKGWLRQQYFPAAGAPRILRENSLHNVLSAAGGLLLRRRGPGERVEQGELLGEILDPCTGQVQQLLRSDCSSRVFFCRHAQLINGHEVAFRLLPE